MKRSTEVDFKVGEWWVRPQLNELQKGDVATRLEARSVQVLTCLARHAPKVVSKERIIEEVWEDAFVGDEVVSHAIWELRRALDDDARNSRFIQTIPRKGYRLISEVSFTRGAVSPHAGARIGRYAILEELGSGAMGVVYRALDEQLHREVALKFLAPELLRDEMARRRFLREARLTASLDHPNLATVHEIGETAEGRQYIVTAHYGGGSLKERLSKGSLDIPEALSIGLQVARGLGEAHRHGIIHRDVKPDNIFLADNGLVKIGDFGIAKLAGATRLTRTGTALGTPAYKSPEQTRGEEVDHRTDIWSLGIVLYESLSGRLPFRGDFDHAVVHSILEEDPKPLELRDTYASQHLDVILGRMLAKEPNERYQTAKELIDTLGVMAKSPRESQIRHPIETPQRGLWRVIATAAAVSILLALALLWAAGLLSSKPPDPVALEIERLVAQGTRYERNGDGLEDLRAAIQSFESALELRPDNPYLQARLALLLCRMQNQIPKSGRLENIQELTTSSMSQAPDSRWSWLALGKLRLLEKEYEAAESAAREAIARTPRPDSEEEEDQGYTLLGVALIRLGREAEGLAALRQGVEIGQGHLRARLALAYHLKWTLDRPHEAVTAYKKVLRYDENRIEALTNLGIIYNEMGSYADALPLLKKSLGQQRDPRTANVLGAVYFNLQRWKEASEAFQLSIKLAPDFPQAYDGLGDTYKMLEQPEEALRWYRQACDLYQDSVEAGGAKPHHFAQLAVCLAKLGRLDEATSQIEKLLAETSNKQSLSFYATQIYALAGNRRKLFEFIGDAVKDLASLDVFRSDPSFAAFQEDPEFRALLEGDREFP